jgi:hypothetical protein|nr:MAG TPA: hypothetical protein [Caudoviricetes sp.]
METKIINNRYELIACTAIATEAGDTEEQSAILCRDMDACLGDAFCVYFGYTLDELADSIEDADYPDFSDDTLATVRIDGQPISGYCF